MITATETSEPVCDGLLHEVPFEPRQGPVADACACSRDHWIIRGEWLRIVDIAPPSTPASALLAVSEDRYCVAPGVRHK
eukprot:970887-Pyramimonas_sp.AAC.1